MPKGKHLSAEERRNIWFFVTHLGWNANQVFEFLFEGDATRTSLETIVKHVRKVTNLEELDLQWYLLGPKRSGGRPPRISNFLKGALLQLIQDKARNIRTLHQLYLEFLQEWHPFDLPMVPIVPSFSSIRRTMVHDHDYSYKVAERVHAYRDDTQRRQFLEDISWVPVHNLIDIDETASSAEEFQKKYGWAPRGDPCRYTQFVINGRRFSTIAAFSYYGFLCWQIIEGGVDSDTFIDFLQTKLALVLQRGKVGLIDNAKIHKTVHSLHLLEATFQGSYYFSPPYSPDYKPIEFGFADIKRFLRDNELEAVHDPIGWINLAFDKFSVTGDCSHIGKPND